MHTKAETTSVSVQIRIDVAKGTREWIIIPKINAVVTHTHGFRANNEFRMSDTAALKNVIG